MYLRDAGSRSVFQGDVFDDVPIVKMGAGDTETSDPKFASPNRRSATPILYPCDMVGPDNVSLIKAQPIALVYDAGEKGLSIPADWEGVLGVCPLPDLRGDGRMWVADFRRITTVERSYLRPERRIRCLSEYGWAVFRQRLVAALSRALPTVDDMLTVGHVTWAESKMEAAWVAAGRDRSAFHSWLDDPDPELPYPTRRRALESHEFDAVSEALRRTLSELDLTA
jgi:hypothetical protein